MVCSRPAGEARWHIRGLFRDRRMVGGWVIDMSADSSALARFKLWRESFLDRHSSADDWRNKYFSGTSWCLWRAAAPMMEAHCRGLVLDAGAGRSGWRKTILRTAKACEGLDIAQRGGI